MGAKTKILIVEHDPNDLELLQYELKKGGIEYTSEVVQNEEDYTHALMNFIPDIILCDYSLPLFDGPSAFKMRGEIAPDIPFIFVSGTIGEENSIEYIKNGLTDYALKDRLFTLSSKIKRALRESREKRKKKKTEQERILNERRLARAQRVAHMGSWELEFTTNRVLLSDEACRIYGLTPKQSNQSFEAWLEFIHPEDLTVALQKIKASRDFQQNFAFHHRIVLKNGSVRHIYSESKYEFDITGKPVGLYGITQDVTQIRLAEEKIEFDKNNLAALINNTNDLMWSVDRECNLITFNRPFYEIIKFVSGKELEKGDNVFTPILSSEQEERFRRSYARAFRGESFTEIEHIPVPVESWSEISYYPIRRGDEVIGTACHSRDITERKKAEEKMMRHVKALSEVAFMQSHQVRAPIASILGLINLFKFDIPSDPVNAEILHRIEVAAKTFDKIIHDIVTKTSEIEEENT